MHVNSTSSSTTDLLNYAKLILSKVSFDEHLFRREIRKFLTELKPEDCGLLKNWCLQEFGHTYQLVLLEEFAKDR